MFIFLNGASDSLILFKFKNISRFLLSYFRVMISYCLAFFLQFLDNLINI